MRFHAEHRFPAPAGLVVAVLADPSFYEEIELPDVELVEVAAHGDDGNQASLLLRYEFVGHLDPIVHRLLGSRQLIWVQQLTLDRQASTGRLTFAVEASPERVRGTVDFRFIAGDHDTVRRLDGEVEVAVPLIGSNAERRIVPGFLRRLDIEAQALTDRLRA